MIRPARLAAVLLALGLAGCQGPDGSSGEADPHPMQGAGENPCNPHSTAADPQRGGYLATAVTLCMFCHSEIDWTAEGYPPKADTFAAGRAPFGPAVPWLASPNLTPDRQVGAGDWSDEQFERAIRRGIAHDGRVLHPLMPYHAYHAMSDEDVLSIIGYLRTLRPIGRALPPTELPGEVRSTLSPLPPTRTVRPPARGETAAYGSYLATLALCERCHTPQDAKGNPIEGMEFAGGMRLQGPWGDVSALNLTPDPSGLGGLDEKLFIQTMRSGHIHDGALLNSVMPWRYYRQMTDPDLRAIYRYLRSLKPVDHFVGNAGLPIPCRKCGGTHGLGHQND